MGLLQLLLQSCLMAIATFAVACIPLRFSSQGQLRTAAPRESHASPTTTAGSARAPWIDSRAVSVFSVGLLVSTALSIVIPEGVGVILSSDQTGREGEREGEVHEHLEDGGGEEGVSELGTWIGLALCSGFLLMFCIHQYAGSHHHQPHSAEPRDRQHPPHYNHPRRSDPAPAGPNSARSVGYHYDVRKDVEAGAGNDNDISPSSTPSQPASADLASIHARSSSDYFSVASSAKLARPNEGTADPLNPSAPVFSTYIGILFHALADGVSLGAAASVSSSVSGAPGALAIAKDEGVQAASSGEAGGASSLSAVIFLSLLIHKAPVAFSLSTLLVSSAPGPPSISATSSKATRSQVAKALALFALATPVGAVVTWVILKAIALVTWTISLDDTAEEDGNVTNPLPGSMRGRLEFWTGMALLFSAGTFLFVASHLVSELNDEPLCGSEPSHQDLSLGDEEHLHFNLASRRSLRRRRVVVFVAGMLTPLVLSSTFGGHHHH